MFERARADRRTTRSRCLRRSDVCMRETPSYGTPASGHGARQSQALRTAVGGVGGRGRVAGRTLHQAHIEANLVPLNDLPTKDAGVSRRLWRAFCSDVFKRADAPCPRSGRRAGRPAHTEQAMVSHERALLRPYKFECEAARTDVCHDWGLLRMRLLSVSRILVCRWQGGGVSSAVAGVRGLGATLTFCPAYASGK